MGDCWTAGHAAAIWSNDAHQGDAGVESIATVDWSNRLLHGEIKWGKEAKSAIMVWKYNTKTCGKAFQYIWRSQHLLRKRAHPVGYHHTWGRSVTQRDLDRIHRFNLIQVRSCIRMCWLSQSASTRLTLLANHAKTRQLADAICGPRCFLTLDTS